MYLAVAVAQARGEELLFPPDDRVVLDGQQKRHGRDEPRQVGDQRQPDPQRDVAEVQRVADPSERP